MSLRLTRVHANCGRESGKNYGESGNDSEQTAAHAHQFESVRLEANQKEQTTLLREATPFRQSHPNEPAEESNEGAVS